MTRLILFLCFCVSATLVAQAQDTPIFFENFEDNQLDDQLEAIANVQGENGVVELRNYDNGLGSYDIRLGKTTDGTEATINRLELTLDLSTYANSELEFSFWFRHYFDETQLEDAIYLSDGGDFVRVIALEPSKWEENVYHQFPTFDLDSLIREAGLSFSSNFVIRFQQSGTADFVGGSGRVFPGDGLYLDDILVKVADPIQYATLPFAEDFEDGLGSSWKARYAELDEAGNATNGTTPANRIFVDENDGVDGSNALGIGRRYDGENANVAAIDLHLNLSTYLDNELEFSFWFKHYFDETQVEDAIYLSDNGGATFERVIALTPEAWPAYTYGSFPVFDLDSLIRKAGLSFSSNFVIRFQQSGTADFVGGSGRVFPGDGLYLDDILVKVADPIQYATLPFAEDFEDGLGSSWKARYAELDEAGNATNGTTPAVLITIFSEDRLNRTASLGLGKRYNEGGESISAVDLYLNLANAVDNTLDLSLDLRDYFDERDPEDGLFFSADAGKTFQRIYNFDADNTPNNQYVTIELNLQELLAAEGITPTATSVLRFQQKGTGSFASNRDGLIFDNISITSGNLAAPVLAEPTVAGTTVNLSWSHDSDDESGYYVLRQQGNTAADTVATLDANVVNYTDSGLQPEQTYTYSVVAFDATDATAASNLREITTGPETSTPPTIAAPANFKVEQIGLSVRLTWEAVVDDDDIDGYAVFRQLGGDDEPRLITTSGLASDTREFLDTELEPGRTYFYWVGAYVQDGQNTNYGDFAGPIRVDIPELVTSLNNLEDYTELIRLYPNPAENQLRITFKNDQYGVVQLRVVNALGQIQYSRSLDKQQLVAEEAINVAGWQSGVYFVEIVQENSRSIQRLVKY